MTSDSLTTEACRGVLKPNYSALKPVARVLSTASRGLYCPSIDYQHFTVTRFTFHS